MNKRKFSPLAVNTVIEVDVPIEVIVWNYLDAEHLSFVHKGYSSPRVLVRHGDTTFFISRLKVPRLPIYFRTTNLVFVPTFGQQVTVTVSSIALMKTEIRITSLENGRTRVETEYEWFLKRFLRPLTPILRRKIIQWNEQVNEEDRPLRKRRAFMTAHGFSDFHGMRQLKSNDRTTISLPMRILPDSPILHEAFSIETKRRAILNFTNRTIEILERTQNTGEDTTRPSEEETATRRVGPMRVSFP